MKPRAADIASKIQNWVKENKLPLGARLPSASAMASALGTAASTTNLAFLELTREGYLRQSGYKRYLASTNDQKLILERPVWIISCFDQVTPLAETLLSRAGIPFITLPVHSPWEANDVFLALRKACREGCSGILLWTVYWNERIHDLIINNNHIPIITCSECSTQDCNFIQYDHREGVYKALAHLYELGHREIAHITNHATFNDPNTLLKKGMAGNRRSRAVYKWESVLMEEYGMACIDLGLGSSSYRIWPVDDNNSIHDIQNYVEQNPEVTAVFCHDTRAVSITQAVLVPMRLSVVGYFNMPAGQTSTPPLTTISGTSHAFYDAGLAVAELLSILETKQQNKKLAGYSQLRTIPQLIVRKSTRHVGNIESGLPASKSPLPRAETRAWNPFETWRNLYPTLQKSASQQWLQLDLRFAANRAMDHQHGWPALVPLLNFPSGLSSIHGVPFTVIDKSSNGNRDIIVMRSAHAHTTNGLELPDKLSIPVESKCGALYILHGCTFARPVNFACYEIIYASGKTLSIPLIPLANMHDSNPLYNRANIQDWWYTFKQSDFGNARHLLVTNVMEPDVYQRYLYTYEWINPYPELKVKALRILSQASAETTLVVFGITLCL